jgi:hypothetical protein
MLAMTARGKLEVNKFFKKINKMAYLKLIV